MTKQTEKTMILHVHVRLHVSQGTVCITCNKSIYENMYSLILSLSSCDISATMLFE